MRTYSPKASEITRKWHVVDADGLVLGRLATEVARVLRGKHKPVFAPHIDTGDHVIVINADKVVLTANKAEKKIVYRHSGYPGGLKTPVLRRRPGRQARGSRAPGRPRHAPEEPPRPPDAHQAEGVRRPQPPPLGAAARAARDRRRPAHRLGEPPCPSPSCSPPVAASRPSPVSGCAPTRPRATARSPSTSAPLADYFPSKTHQMILTEPLRATELTEAYDIDATIFGGGPTGQAGALRLGIARALIELDPELRATLKQAGFLTRDAREKESKKYGLKKARKAPQYSKR